MKKASAWFENAACYKSAPKSVWLAAGEKEGTGIEWGVGRVHAC